MNNFNVNYLLFVFSVLIASFSQILLKVSANRKHKSMLKEYSNVFVISAYFLFLISLILTSRAYKSIPLTHGILIENIGIVFVLLLGRVFLNEKLTKKAGFGVVLIFLGIIIATR